MEIRTRPRRGCGLCSRPMSDKDGGRDENVRKGRVGRRIDPAFDRLVRGEKPERKRGRHLDDPRQHGLVRGVANREVRAVAEFHSERLGELLREDTPELRERLALLLGMEIWRGLSFISKKAFLEDGLELERSHWAHEIKPRRDLAEATIALWYRLEAARIRKGAPGWIGVESEGKKNFVELRLPAEEAHHIIAEMGRSVTPLVRDDQAASKPAHGHKKSRDPK